MTKTHQETRRKKQKLKKKEEKLSDWVRTGFLLESARPLKCQASKKPNGFTRRTCPRFGLHEPLSRSDRNFIGLGAGNNSNCPRTILATASTGKIPGSVCKPFREGTKIRVSPQLLELECSAPQIACCNQINQGDIDGSPQSRRFPSSAPPACSE